MKPRLTPFLASLLLSVALVVPAGISLTGCATPGKTALNVEIASRTTAQIAWTAFRTARAQGRVSDADWNTGVEAVKAFQAAGLATLDVIEQFKANPNQTALQNALIAYSKAWDRLYPLLVKYTPGLNKNPPPP